MLDFFLAIFRGYVYTTANRNEERARLDLELKGRPQQVEAGQTRVAPDADLRLVLEKLRDATRQKLVEVGEPVVLVVLWA
jgi:hypothetical protein